MRATKLDESLARAVLYRFLALGFAYPSNESYEVLRFGVEVGRVGADMLSKEIAAELDAVAEAVAVRSQSELADEYRDLFSFSSSPDCPLNECAYGAKHLYQEVHELADMSGFYRAFGLDVSGQRPDELPVQLEFLYLLTLKEARAREDKRSSRTQLCRDAQRTFMRDHLGRWAENIGRRLEVLAPGTAYAALGRLLNAFAAFEIQYLGLVGEISPYEEVPNPPEPLDDGECAAEVGVPLYELKQEDLISELVPVSERSGNGG
jgi:putative dimethyl sulfoxide reductase chaperone